MNMVDKNTRFVGCFFDSVNDFLITVRLLPEPLGIKKVFYCEDIRVVHLFTPSYLYASFYKPY